MSDPTRQGIRLAFSDFWPGFDPTHWFGVRALRRLTPVDVVNDARHADLLFAGPFGDDHRSFSGTKVVWSGESPPVPSGFDYTISHHLATVTGPTHLRLPFWTWMLLQHPEELAATLPIDADVWRARPNFCNFVYSNWAPKHRRDFHRVLSARRFVHAAGDVHRNAPRLPSPGADEDGHRAKLGYLRSFRFTIAFENEMIDGYTTEKLTDALIAGTIPIYWGNRRFDEEFDRSRVIVAHDFDSLDELADHVCALDDGDLPVAPYLASPALPEDTVQRAEHALGAFLERVVADLAPTPRRRRRALVGAVDHRATAARQAARRTVGAGTRRMVGAPAGTYLGATTRVAPATPVAPASPLDATRPFGGLVVATAASADYFDRLLTLVASVHRSADDPPEVRCLDLGLTGPQRRLLARLHGVEREELPSDLIGGFPHLADPSTFAWKLWWFHELAARAMTFLYLDAGARVVGDLGRVLDVLDEVGLLLVDDPSHLNAAWTHAAAVRILTATPEELAGNQLCSGIVGARPGADRLALFREALDFALIEECIAGSRSDHRQDQSILSILTERHGWPRQSLEEFGEWRGVLHDHQVVHVHRGGVLDHTGLRWERPPLPARIIHRVRAAAPGRIGGGR